MPSDPVGGNAMGLAGNQVTVPHGRRKPSLGIDARPGRILHVTEAFGGGVAAAIGDYVSAAPDLEHWLLVSRRPECPAPLPKGVNPAAVIHLPSGHRARRRAIAEAYGRLRPDRVHAHSSLAGAYCRQLLTIPSDNIVYTPHCYAFERQDTSSAVRAAFWIAERLMTVRTGVVAACSPREAQLARRMGAARVVHVPNIVLPVSDVPLSSPCRNRRPVAVAVGRLCPQKDPAFFARAAAAAPSLDWVWIGEGDTRLRQLLEDAGVRVTGWLDRREIRRRLGEASVYVHTAAWEGAPLALLEAVGAGLPVAARYIPALAALGLRDLARTPAGLAELAGHLAVPGGIRDQHLAFLADSFLEHTPAVQSARLHQAYALEASSDPGVRHAASQVSSRGGTRGRPFGRPRYVRSRKSVPYTRSGADKDTERVGE
ncbi:MULTISPECIES: glycosyltransferase [Streptomyces]|uniref:glycosyltransferase n=1 Tax=Streptomyces TaxID=1883 RepID=UPI0014899FEE|nr:MULTISPECIES: glycosyltransferase [Streptomyces]